MSPEWSAVSGDRVEQLTSALFGGLWHRYDSDLFEESVDLFARRFAANGFDLRWFEGRRCLDAGSGGGRYSIAMARLGARTVIGCDISLAGLVDARRRAAALRYGGCAFQVASVLELPYATGSFDFVCCSGVLHHTPDSERGLRELVRVLRPRGRLYLLLYGTGGLRWPTIIAARAHAQAMGVDLLDRAIRLAGLSANKRRTFLDDLFVPILRFYDQEELEAMLRKHGLVDVARWERGRLDHEASLPTQRAELEQLRRIFETALESPEPEFQVMSLQARAAAGVIAAALKRLDELEAQAARGRISEAELRWQVFGWGNHRVLGVKG